MKFAHLFFALGLIFTVQGSVLAQEFVIPGKTITKTTVTREYSDPNLPDSIKQRMQPGIRYTVGTTQVGGWERGLTKGTPNLKNYFWCTMPKSNQAWVTQKTKTQTRTIPPQVRKYHYNKPIQVKTINPYNRMPPPPAPDVPKRVASRSESRADVNTSAKLQFRKTELPKAYKAYPTNDYSTNSDLSGSIVSKQGSAKLLTPTKHK